MMGWQGGRWGEQREAVLCVNALPAVVALPWALPTKHVSPVSSVCRGSLCLFPARTWR